MKKIAAVIGACLLLVGGWGSAFGQQVTVGQALNIIIAAGKTVTFNNTLTFSGTDGSTLNMGTGGTLSGSAFQTYANGSWTPTDNSGAGLVFTGVSVNYTRIGAMVYVYGRLTYPTTVSGANASITGLPVTVANANYGFLPCVINPVTNFSMATLGANSTVLNFFATSSTLATNAQLSGQLITFNCTYPAL